jgi:aspartate-semialdehyde dehydrogenase
MKLAIVGASGAVGHEFLGVLERSSLKFAELQLYASPRSAGTQLPFRGEQITVQVMPEGAIPADVILASAGGSVSHPPGSRVAASSSTTRARSGTTTTCR